MANSKYPQKICSCNASDMLHKHEDDGIFDCPSGSTKVNVVIPKTTMKPTGFIPSK